MRSPFATALVSRNALLRECLAQVLRGAGFRIVASTETIDESFFQAKWRRQPALLIVESGDDVHPAIRQIELFRQRFPDGRVVVIAGCKCREDVVAALRAGANAYFVQVTPWDAFVKSLQLVMLGEAILPTAMLSMVLDEGRRDETTPAVDPVQQVVALPACSGAAISDVPPLSARERSILSCLIEGDSNKVIARKIAIAEATVKVHVKAILRKIRVQNRTKAAIWAMSNGVPFPEGGLAAPANAMTNTRTNGAAH